MRMLKRVLFVILLIPSLVTLILMLMGNMEFNIMAIIFLIVSVVFGFLFEFVIINALVLLLGIGLIVYGFVTETVLFYFIISLGIVYLIVGLINLISSRTMHDERHEEKRID